MEITGIKPELLLGLNIIDSTCSRLYNHDITITSVVDGLHSSNSLHYVGQAADIRIRDFAGHLDLEIVTNVLASAVGPLFDVVLEKDHIHIEYQPKR